MLLRVVDMRRVDLRVFVFDYDLEWAGLFLHADGTVLGRFGGREPDSASRYLTIAGLRHAMREALTAHRQHRPIEGPPREPLTVEQFAGIRRHRPTACIHCHNAREFAREQAQKEGTWRRDDAWVYPTPATVGLHLDPERQDRVQRVDPDTAAARLGLRPGDVLRRVGSVPTASFADVQYGLHLAPAEGSVTVAWQRDGRETSGTLQLRPGWRETDLSWRGSTKTLGPPPCVYGKDLTEDEKRAVGLDPKRLAFRQGNFVSEPARQAGIRRGDILLGVDGKELNMTAAQFGVYIRLNYRVGDRIVFNVLRDGRREDIPLTLPARALF